MKLDNFIEELKQRWIDLFRKENLLHLDEPLLRKENEYYLVNIKLEVISIAIFLKVVQFSLYYLLKFTTALHVARHLYQMPHLIFSSETEDFYQQINRFQQQFIDLGGMKKNNCKEKKIHNMFSI